MNDVIAKLKLFFRLMFLSVTSSDFYKDVFFRYSGYGVRMAFDTNYLAQVCVCIVLLLNFFRVVDFLETNKVTNLPTQVLENVFKQWPEMHFDGKNMSSDDEDPSIILSKMGKKIIAIDTFGQLKFNERKSIPIILNSNNVEIKMPMIGDSYAIAYSDILDLGDLTISSSNIAKIMFDLYQSHASEFKNTFIYKWIPIYMVYSFLEIILDKAFEMVVLYIICNIFVQRTMFQQISRLVLFSSCVAIAISPMVLIFSKFYIVLNMINLWSMFLIWKALWEIKSKAK